ncbi:MAG: DUF2851 family protein [Bacteroidetes bacterium]|nr:DUF2851 family protein [Bacteroidota bacterium]
MKEDFLQFIWKLKRFDHSNLRLADGRELIINKHGEFNSHENGPDFFNAQITIDSISWFGNIEIHTKSSDWFNHKHQLDISFKNVILHVVWEHDKEVHFLSETLPVLELKNRIPANLFSNLKSLKLNYSAFPCQKLIKNLDLSYLTQMISSSFVNRMERKILHYFHLNEDEFIYRLMAKSFGGKSNQFSFEYIAESLPYSLLNKLDSQKKRIAINSCKTLLTKDSNKIQVVPYFKQKGMRPQSTPDIRIEQFINCIQIIEELKSFTILEAREFVFYFRRKISDVDKTISFTMQNHLLLNLILPYFFYLGYSSIEFREKAIEIAEILPPEKNNIVEQMKLLGFSIKNSFDSQAVLEIYSEFCQKKKCLNCTVGAKIINL